MDAVSIAFATFLTGISQSYASRVANEVTDIIGSEVQSQVVNYNDREISYQYQLWKIRDNSVCTNLRENLLDYSECTVAARDMFGETCKYLQERPSDHWRYKKLKNMYCHAAVEFKPTIASVSDAPESQDELAEKRQACNLATAEAMGSTDAVLIQKRNAACTAYKTLKNSRAP